MLKSELIKLIIFERKEVRLFYIGVTGFGRTPPLLPLYWYYVYYA